LQIKRNHVNIFFCILFDINYGRPKVAIFHKLNHQITAPQVRVIDEVGKQIGVLSLTDALKKAQEQQLDLVEIAPDAKPPVVKIIEYKKLKYLEEKKRKEARKHTKETELKEVRLSPFIGEHDLETGLNKIKKFLQEGDLVKVSIIFKGRQMTHTEFGPKLLEKVLYLLDGIAVKDKEAKFQGRRYITVLKPVKGNMKQETDNKKSATLST